MSSKRSQDNRNPLNFNSRLIHSGGFDDCLGSATVPIYQTSVLDLTS